MSIIQKFTPKTLTYLYYISFIPSIWFFVSVLSNGGIYLPSEDAFFRFWTIYVFNFCGLLLTPINISFIKSQSSKSGILISMIITSIITLILFLFLSSIGSGPTEEIISGVVFYTILMALILQLPGMDPGLIRKVDEIQESDDLPEIARQYSAKQLKVLAVEIQSINSVEELDKRIVELLEENIDRLSYLLEVEGLNPPSKKLLIEYCFDQSTPLRNSLKKAISRYLRGQILEQDLTDFDIEMEIDNLITEYEQMEIQGLGKLV